MLLVIGAPVFGSDAVPSASAVQRSADIALELSQGLEEVGWGEDTEAVLTRAGAG